MNPISNNPISKIIHGDCLEEMRKMADNSIDAIVTDPPYFIGFMGKKFDTPKNNIAASKELWAEALRICKPGAHCLAFGGDRTHHHLMIALENAGWEIRTCVYWIQSQGFPKSHNFGCKCKGIPLQYNHDKVSLSISQDVQNVQPDFLLSQPHASIAQENMLKTMHEKIAENSATAQEKTSSYLSMVPEAISTQIQNGEEQSENMQLCLQGSTSKESSRMDGSYEKNSQQSKGQKASWDGHEVGKESSLEGGRDLQEKQGELFRAEICEMPAGISFDGEKRRLYNGTSLSDGQTCEPNSTAQGSRSSQRSQYEKQPDREFGAFREQSSAQDRRGETCENCKGIIGFEGYGTALKPAAEIIVVAMKPCEGTFAQNAQKWGLAGINIEACRVKKDENDISEWSQSGSKQSENRSMSGKNYDREPKPDNAGRWPANIILDEEAAEQLDFLSGNLKSGKPGIRRKEHHSVAFGKGLNKTNEIEKGFGDSGGASRFFYCPKASSSERNRGLDKPCSHPTVKPIALMKYLLKLLASPNDPICLDPFAGSGSTLIAAKELGIRCIGIEKEAEYCEIARKRIEA